MSHVHVCLVSEQTIPNILGIYHFKPDSVWFITTERMEKDRKTECIENTLRLKGLRPQTTKTIVDQDSLTDCQSKIESLIEVDVSEEVEYVINITGGNKIMALAVYEIFRQIEQRVIIGYIPIGRNEFIQIFPRKRPLKIFEIKQRLNLEEYLHSYGFKIQNKDKLKRDGDRSLSHEDSTKWIMENYEQLKGMMGFLYKMLGDKRKGKNYRLSCQFNRDLTGIERELLRKFAFNANAGLIEKDMTKDEIIYLTGGWFEEYVFNDVYELKEKNIIDDIMLGMKIESLGGAVNDLDISFMKNNVFYYIECKTLGDESEQAIVRDEVYKKGAISALLGKGEKRAIICTTHDQISGALSARAKEYGVEILPIQQVRDLKNRLLKRFGVH
ncbi:MAG: DUF1887 family protein [Nitrospirae bacterium]|nr:DUF1887 family protein [Nitrospirota bacterium]